MASLKLVQNIHSLPLKMRPKPDGHLFDRTNPFTGIDRITDSVNTPIGCPEVCIVTKNCKIKETGAAACANAPVIDQGLYKLPVDPAA